MHANMLGDSIPLKQHKILIAPSLYIGKSYFPSSHSKCIHQKHTLCLLMDVQCTHNERESVRVQPKFSLVFNRFFPKFMLFINENVHFNFCFIVSSENYLHVCSVHVTYGYLCKSVQNRT